MTAKKKCQRDENITGRQDVSHDTKMTALIIVFLVGGGGAHFSYGRVNLKSANVWSKAASIGLLMIGELKKQQQMKKPSSIRFLGSNIESRVK